MSRDLRILILEDVEADAELMRHELRRADLDFTSKRVETEEAFRQGLEGFKPDLILSDYKLPHFDGMAALAIAREKSPSTPFICVSGSIGEDRAVELLKSGATDYVLKDRMTQLAPAVRRALRETEERAERKRLEEELLQSEKMASVGLLIGGVAHELNNPLTSILGHVELLLMETSANTQLHSDLSVIKRETDRCARLIKSLLAFARKHEHRLLESDLNALVREILDLKTYDLRRAQVDLIPDLAAGLPPVLVDPHQIQQVLLNLLNNAEHAMEKAKGTLRVETRLDGDQVLLCVADTGLGIAPENLKRIFQPFFTTKEPGKGTGLGLSICATIVKEHGGTLAVESKPGEGARFTLFLPAAKKPAARPPERTAVRRQRRILLLDDQQEVLQFMVRALKQSGREVKACAKPEDALEALRSAAYDTVISDFYMPGMNGEQFYRQAVEIRPELSNRFILLTGQTYLDSAKPFAQSCHIPILVKPFDLVEFERTLLRVEDPESRAAAGGAR